MFGVVAEDIRDMLETCLLHVSACYKSQQCLTDMLTAASLDPAGRREMAMDAGILYDQSSS